MNKTSIKVIKRKDAEAVKSACEPNEIVNENNVTAEKTERRSRREIVDTVSNWITERKENNRHEEIAAIRKIFGNSPVLGGA